MVYDQTKDKMIGVVVVFSYPGLEELEQKFSRGRIPCQYRPGYLSFREGACLVKAYQKLERKPSVIIFDGQGIAHPAKLGLASHLGIILDVPSIGCAKSYLVGEYSPPGPERGSWSKLIYKGEEVGIVLRTRDKVKPVFVSPGYKIGFKEARTIILNCTPRYRIPEPLRQAHILGGKLI